MADRQKLAAAVEAAAKATSTGHTAQVKQTGHLGMYALRITGEHITYEVFGNLDDMELLGQQILLDVQRQRDMAHLWWTPEVEA